ncbi:MAG: GtrA family protein [Syntrophobacter sp.]
MQFLVYLFIGGVSALVNLFLFLALFHAGLTAIPATSLAFFIAAAINYGMCILLLFRHKARWNTTKELLMYVLVVIAVGIFDVAVTNALLGMGSVPWVSKSIATMAGLVLNFAGRRYLVFPESPSGPWKQQG